MTTTKPTRNPEFRSRLLPDGYVLIHSENSEWVHTLSPVGGLVWEFCDGSNTPEEIAAIITTQTQLAAKTEDIVQLIADLDKNGLLGTKS